jgi:exopolysaccharide production protein ExoZ
MYFYYIYAIAINFHATLLPWILGAWMLLTAAIFFAFPQTKMPYLAQMGNTITYEFSYGLLIGWWQIQKRKPIAALPIIAVGTVIVLLNTAFYSGYGSYLHGPLRFLFVGLPMAFILYGFVGLEVNKQFTCAGLIVLLGDASYSLYLWHAPILDAIGHLSMHRHILSQPIFHWLWLALSTAIVIAIALLLYRTIEYRLVRAFGKLLHLKSPGSILPNVSAITPSN